MSLCWPHRCYCRFCRALTHLKIAKFVSFCKVIWIIYRLSSELFMKYEQGHNILYKMVYAHNISYMIACTHNLSIRDKTACAPSENSDQPCVCHRLIRRRFGSLTSHRMPCEDSLDTAQAQADLSLRCAHMHACKKYCAAAHF